MNFVPNSASPVTMERDLSKDYSFTSIKRAIMRRPRLGEGVSTVDKGSRYPFSHIISQVFSWGFYAELRMIHDDLPVYFVVLNTKLWSEKRLKFEKLETALQTIEDALSSIGYFGSS